MSGFLDDGTLDALKVNAIHAELYDADKRRLLFFRITHLRGKIPKSDIPENQLRLDLNFLNETPPQNGTIPMLVWLENARPLVAATAEQDFFEDLLQSKSGQPGGSRLRGEEKIHNEAILFEDDMLPAEYLAQGLVASRSVMRLLVPRFGNGIKHKSISYWGTGWLIAPSLLITNYHVFNARNDGEEPAGDGDLRLQAINTEAQFDIETDGMTTPLIPILGIEAFDSKLDFAIARIDLVTDRSPLELSQTPMQIRPREVIPLNIIQHPGGNPKKIAIRNNLATPSSGESLRYFTATLGGSSGSPVLNDSWKVVALHRGSVGTKVLSFQGRTTAVVNLGTCILSILGTLSPELKKDMLLSP